MRSVLWPRIKEVVQPVEQAIQISCKIVCCRGSIVEIWHRGQRDGRRRGRCGGLRRRCCFGGFRKREVQHRCGFGHGLRFRSREFHRAWWWCFQRLGLAHDGALRHLRCGDHACGFLAGFIRIEVRDGRRHVPFGLGLCTKDALDDGLCGRRRASNLRSGAHRDAPRFEVLQLVGDGTLVKGRHRARLRGPILDDEQGDDHDTHRRFLVVPSGGRPPRAVEAVELSEHERLDSKFHSRMSGPTPGKGVDDHQGPEQQRHDARHAGKTGTSCFHRTSLGPLGSRTRWRLTRGLRRHEPCWP